jgi:hypothetical protein
MFLGLLRFRFRCYKRKWLLGFTMALVFGGLQTSLAVDLSAQELSARVDYWIDTALSQRDQPLGMVCDDASFLRRVTLDLTGRQPSAYEVDQFLRDSREDKRAVTIDRLLASPSSAVHLANIWSAWLLPETLDVGLAQQRAGLHQWLRERFAKNLRYDRLVADLLVTAGSGNTGPGAFYISLEGKPEKLAAKTARVFMGIQLDCAECHDHPFDHWKQRDFWGLAAYFARLSLGGMQNQGGMVEIVDSPTGEVRLPTTQDVVAPQPLVATGLSGLTSGTRRQQLALWLTARENPYLARAVVNRCWSHLFGRGLVEPIDDMRASQLASHPELLDELAQSFVASEFDLRGLLRALVNSRAYQRSTASALPVPGSQSTETDNYATMPHKPLTAWQMATCLQQVAREISGEPAQARIQALAQQLGKLRGDNSRATLGVVQALVTMHSDQLNPVYNPADSRLLQALSAPHLDHEQRIYWLFLSTLCRPPRADELAALRQLEPGTQDVTDDGAESSKTAVTEPNRTEPAAILATWQSDLLWALVNSTEFAMTP